MLGDIPGGIFWEIPGAVPQGIILEFPGEFTEGVPEGILEKNCKAMR